MGETVVQYVEAISKYLAERTPPQIMVAPDEDMFTQGVLDSLGIADLVAFLESCYDIQIPMGDITVENFATLNALSAYVDGRLSSR